ncbi:AAA family ATPase [Paenibacillus sp. D2_2]|uniref:AAA family ATPase n=1 Tax=Paenibacillus sp. D2_2 TaxID=3073092 RepID=UPI002815E751|nr:AAA family ATPase [Paenibacillus sp. D2_2]WMT42030.1 AAA family ATPase [Paenibacillus sp. D2_2]
MKLLVVAGGFHRMVRDNFPKKIDFFNSEGLELGDLKEFVLEEMPKVDSVLITDEAFSYRLGQDREHLAYFLEWVKDGPRSEIPVIVITRDRMKVNDLASLSSRYTNLRIVTIDKIRIPWNVIQFELEATSKKQSSQIHNDSKPVSKNQTPVQADSETNVRRSFFDRFRSKPESETKLEGTDRLSKDLANISRGISRIIAVTGHRGSGVTSTIVNLAHEAAKRGLSTIIIDMDTEYRSMNMYFDRFHERTNKEEQMSASLIHTLARPQDYMTTAFNIKDNLWLTSLGYSFHDRKLIEQFYNNEKLIGLISVLRSRFNLVLLDIPLDLFRHFKETMIHIDVFGLCVPNNLHAVLSTIRNVEVVLDQEKATYLNAKAKVIVTQYNDRSRFQDQLFTPDKVSEVLTSGLSEYFRYDMRMAGAVPYNSGFDSQIETDVPLTNTGAEFERAFGQMLLRLMEGA